MDETELHPLYNVPQIQVTYRHPVPIFQRPKIRCSEDAARIARETWDVNRIELVEQFKILLLDRNYSCLGISEIATGGIAGVLTDRRIIFATALLSKATSIILLHNHPSGVLAASEPDKKMTRELFAAGKVLDIHVADHMILTSNKYYSFADEGIMPD
ncbi:JAB domain-containing protein [Dawidia soli]|uniref:JAB domain-containing protein n=1 Tax=Dawidia soli TaxID=2782352 RepID=A0AAP2DD57_9BACT|nr:JAB domain-containing protein [Dawidia soli]MBT1689868.1 JAB domain-containing protein [Dawidia soli]